MRIRILLEGESGLLQSGNSFVCNSLGLLIVEQWRYGGMKLDIKK